ncbi:unnamed protein product [Pieris brassicae]|uniref:Uncharacterized protein n=1 Tax=Pieris brassicae TaxID=7116 RepID=A0A9P0XGU5_PIEBR|nr:unnamed protein product [Pieris brassicae]
MIFLYLEGVIGKFLDSNDVTHLNPAHFAGDVCGADAHSSGGGAKYIPDQCSLTLSRGTSHTGDSLTLAAHFHKTIPQAPYYVSLSHHVISLDTNTGLANMGSNTG